MSGLNLLFDKEEYPIVSETVIGRHPACAICIPDNSVSKQHCQILDGWLQDLGSTNGTKLNGQLLPADRKVQIKDKDVIILGDAKLHVVKAWVDNERKGGRKKTNNNNNNNKQELSRSKRFVGLKPKARGGGRGGPRVGGRATKSADPALKLDLSAVEAKAVADEGEEAEPDSEAEREAKMTVTELMEAEFANIIGHEQIKVQLKTFYKKVQLDTIRAQAGKTVPKSSLYHMMFLGPPGTGKTTMANLVAKIMVKMNLIENDNVVFVGNALDLLAGYSGQTPAKVEEKVLEAKGGVLFIDEAYSIVKETHQKDSFGKEAIETIMKHLDPPSCVFIFAGYEKPMESFLKVNQGLARRIPYRYVFQPYAEKQLIDIMHVMIDHAGEDLGEGVAAGLTELLAQTTEQQRATQNAGLVSNWVNFAQGERDYRIDIDEARANPAIASTLELVDFVAALEKVKGMSEEDDSATAAAAANGPTTPPPASM